MRCDFNGSLLTSVLPPVLVIECVFGVLGNGLALWIFCFHMRPWKSSTVLLFNLAMADFFLNMALPFRATYYYSDMIWPFGSAICNICLFMLAMNRSGSTLFLMAIAIDRYMRVVHPHHPINSLTVTKAMFGALAMWVLTISLTVHVFSLNHENTTRCESFKVDTNHSLNWHTFEFLLVFYVPLLVVLYCTFRIISYLRRRQLAQQAKIRKALWFIIVVAVLFVICYLPSNIAQLLIWIKTKQLVGGTHTESEVCFALEDLTVVFFIIISLTYLNSMLDPIVYYFSSPVFKNICRKVLHLSQVDTAESTEKKTRETGSQSLSQL